MVILLTVLNCKAVLVLTSFSAKLDLKNNMFLIQTKNYALPINRVLK